MFGLTLEKLFVIAIFAGVLLGPHRLPLYAARLTAFTRDVRAFVESTRARAEDELGVSPSDWVELRRYDPRRIVRDALEEESIDDGPSGAATEVREERFAARPVQPDVALASASYDAHRSPLGDARRRLVDRGLAPSA